MLLPKEYTRGQFLYIVKSMLFSMHFLRVKTTASTGFIRLSILNFNCKNHSFSTDVQNLEFFFRINPGLSVVPITIEFIWAIEKMSLKFFIFSNQSGFIRRSKSNRIYDDRDLSREQSLSRRRQPSAIKSCLKMCPNSSKIKF